MKNRNNLPQVLKEVIGREFETKDSYDIGLYAL